MSMFDSILSSLGGVAGQLASKIIPGAQALPSLVKAGEALIGAFKSIKSLNGGTAPPDAEAQHDALFDKVKAHADSTLGRLEGE
jgi:hypothetical protein